MSQNPSIQPEAVRMTLNNQSTLIPVFRAHYLSNQLTHSCLALMQSGEPWPSAILRQSV